MIPKKLNNCRIDSLRYIRLMEADLNQILKHIARVSMREMEKTGSFRHAIRIQDKENYLPGDNEL